RQPRQRVVLGAKARPRPPLRAAGNCPPAVTVQGKGAAEIVASSNCMPPLAFCSCYSSIAVIYYGQWECQHDNCRSLLPGVATMDTAWFLSQLDRAGLSQADLARHLRLAPSAVSRMLKGERQMKLLEAAQTASFLGVSQDEVL